MSVIKPYKKKKKVTDRPENLTSRTMSETLSPEISKEKQDHRSTGGFSDPRDVNSFVKESRYKTELDVTRRYLETTKQKPA